MKIDDEPAEINITRRGRNNNSSNDDIVIVDANRE
jgi:hypothetical protein